VSHANNLAEATKAVRELIKDNIGKNTELLKKTAEKQQVTFKKILKIYIDQCERADKAFITLSNHFKQNEENFRQGEDSQMDRDLWFLQY
jgi:hypothetical protein